MMPFLRLFSLSLVFLWACKNSKPAVTENASESSQKKDGAIKAKSSARPVHWSYEGESGPGAWGKLSPVYALCQSGEQQSPINISQNQMKEGSLWKINYKKSSLKIAHNENMDDILDNGHTIQVTVDGGSTFQLNHHTYHLKQFHFHTPSEHTIDGKHFPMEVHFVHQSDSGDLAVIAVLIVEGKENPNFEKVLSNLPAKKGETIHLTKVHFSLQFQLPEKLEAYHYQGSLTTPPCSEKVEWLVFKHFSFASKEQIKAFSEKIGNNNRPIQALNKRTISQDVISGKVQD
jgi:carbonic anhydrase